MESQENIATRLEKIKGVLDDDMWHDSSRDQHIIKKPFYFEGKNKTAVLLLHGWTSTPYELRTFGKYLHKQGFTVYAPLLRGHGSHPNHLEKVGYEEWLQDAEKAYKKLHKKHSDIYVGGNSMGASLAVFLANKYEDVVGLMLFGMPYKIKMELFVYYCARIWSLFHKKYYGEKKYSSKYSRAITSVIAYNIYPLKSVFDLLHIIRLAREKLPMIQQPCIVIQSYDDHYVSKNSIDKIYDALGSSVKYKKYIYNAYHNFVADKKHAYVYKEVVRFLKKLQSI